MKHSPLVSIIMNCFNGERYLTQALDSIISQSYSNWELIFWDNQSTDRSAEIVKKYNESRFKYFYAQSHSSILYKARNYALEKASGQFLAFLDVDDWWLPEKLERSIFHIEREKFILVAHNIFVVKGQHQEKLNISGRFQNSSNSLFHGLYRRGFISTSTVVASLSSIRHAGGFYTSLQAGQDFDLWLKMLGPRGSQFFVFDECLAKYYVRDESITRRADSRLSCTIEIARRHAPLLRQHSGSPTISLWFRLVAVHYEAIRAHLNSKKHVSAIRVFLKAPAVIFVETLRLANRFSS